VKRAGGGRPVPVLKTPDGLIQGSSLIAEWADSIAPGTLIPPAPPARKEALTLQRTFDENLGVATRLWAYHHALPNRSPLVKMMAQGVPAWERSAFLAGYPFLTALIRRGMNISARSASYAAEDIDRAFRRVERRLADGRPFLAGDRFSIADITFAALAAPVLLPEEHPAMPGALDAFGGHARSQIQAWRSTRAGAFALELYVNRDGKAEWNSITVS